MEDHWLIGGSPIPVATPDQSTIGSMGARSEAKFEIWFAKQTLMQDQSAML